MGITVQCVFLLLTYLYSRVAANDVCKAYNLHEVLVALGAQGAKIHEMSGQIEVLEKAIEAIEKKNNDISEATSKNAEGVLKNSCRQDDLEKKLEQGSTSTTECDDGWKMHDGSCYLFSDSGTGMRFSRAQVYCTERNASLVHVDDEAENKFIKCNLLSAGESFWLGLRRNAIDRQWKWIDTNTVLEYSDWAPGQPDVTHENEDCVTFWIGFAYSWNDDSCDRSYIYPLCEKEGRKELDG